MSFRESSYTGGSIVWAHEVDDDDPWMELLLDEMVLDQDALDQRPSPVGPDQVSSSRDLIQEEIDMMLDHEPAQDPELQQQPLNAHSHSSPRDPVEHDVEEQRDHQQLVQQQLQEDYEFWNEICDLLGGEQLILQPDLRVEMELPEVPALSPTHLEFSAWRHRVHQELEARQQAQSHNEHLQPTLQRCLDVARQDKLHTNQIQQRRADDEQRSINPRCTKHRRVLTRTTGFEP